MRLVEFSDLKTGMQIADDFYSINGSILAKKGTEISERYIQNLSQYEIPYLYVLDEFSKDLEIQCTITSKTRNEATQNLKKLYLAIQSRNKGLYHKHMQACLESIDKLTEDIISEKIDLYDVFDIKTIENYIYQQPVNVTVISLIIGKCLELSSLEMYRLAIGAFFHDIGNMFIPKEILEKKGKLTDEEYELIKTHTVEGYRFAKDEFNLPMRSYLAILQHHERYDGGGYPTKKAGEDISIYGRIVAIADVFDALSSRRRQREALNPAQAFKMIIEGMGTAFDPKLVRAFADRVSPYPIGFTIKLEDGRECIVTKNFRGKPFNPEARVIKENDKRLETPYIITVGVD
ncbi:MAG: HD-GYP domain-containing protein [Vallitaleaceae bacterium]|nr:HD-GYP domain-containing protein [Vallitaleaceae bacterium]